MITVIKEPHPNGLPQWSMIENSNAKELSAFFEYLKLIGVQSETDQLGQEYLPEYYLEAAPWNWPLIGVGGFLNRYAIGIPTIWTAAIKEFNEIYNK